MALIKRNSPAWGVAMGVGMAAGYYLQIAQPEIYAAICGL